MCCLDLLCCCLGPAACGLCCCGSKIKSSVTTRLLYMSFLFFVLVVSAIMLSPHVQQGLANASILCADANITAPEINIAGIHIKNYVPAIRINSIANCSQFVGYQAVYRVCMGVGSFFFVLMLMMLCVFSSKDPRSYIQNGFWLIKWLVVLGLVVAFFFIPEGDNFIFSRISLALGLAASIIFIVVQIILLVDFAHRWAESWIGKAEENDSKGWYILMLIFSIIFYVGALAGVILMYVFYTELSSCSLNKFFISSTLIVSVAVSIVAILPWIQKVQPKSGLLQASIVTAYCTYVTWSAIATEPYGEVPGTNGTEFYNCRRLSGNNNLAIFSSANGGALAASIVGIIVLFITVAYVCFHLSSNSQLQKLRGGKKDENESLLGNESVYINEQEEGGNDDVSDDDSDEKGRFRMKHVDDEKEKVTYSYSFFHFLMLLALLYFMMQLTNWANPQAANTEHFQNTWASTWVKMASVWVCFAVYLWTLLAPLILGNCRDFGYAEE